MGTSDTTNQTILTDPTVCQLANYVKNPAVYKCAADKSGDIRSMSMNSAVGTRWYDTGGAQKGLLPLTGGWLPGVYNPGQTTWRTYGKLSSIVLPGPVDLWLLMDEHPDSINDSLMCTPAVPYVFVDYPASYHNGAGGLVFADGHAEIHKWVDGRTKLPIKGIYNSVPPAPQSSPGNKDTEYLYVHSSAAR